MKNIIYPIDTGVTFLNDKLKGNKVDFLIRTLADVSDIFEDTEAINELDKTKTAYEVESYLPEKEGTEGGLYFGLTRLFPGKIGKEFMMTKGHFHTKSDRTEFYWGIEGEGILLLMDKGRNISAQKVYPGSLNYVQAHIAHRMVNTGTKILAFGACWPSDAGHDYGTISKHGFAAKVVEKEGKPVIIKKT